MGCNDVARNEEVNNGGTGTACGDGVDIEFSIFSRGEIRNFRLKRFSMSSCASCASLTFGEISYVSAKNEPCFATNDSFCCCNKLY